MMDNEEITRWAEEPGFPDPSLCSEYHHKLQVLARRFKQLEALKAVEMVAEMLAEGRA